MANTSNIPETPKHPPETTIDTTEVTPNPATPAPKRSSQGWLILLVIASLLLAVNANYQWWKSKQRQNLQKLTLVGHIENLQQQLHEHKDVEKALKNRLEKLGQSLQSAVAERSYQQQDWSLLKARFYLELAHINNHWTSDNQVTLVLLRQADAVLQTLNGEPLLAIRQALAKEIAQTETQPSLDVAGILSQLDALQMLITELPLANTLTPANTGNTEGKDQALPAWRQQLQKSLNQLQSLVVVTRYDDKNDPMLSLRNQALLRDHIAMNLQEAQWAVLHQNAKLFQQSLQQALQTLSRAFDKSSESYKSLVQQLETLEQIKFHTESMPENETLQLLNQWIEANKGEKTP